MSPKTSGKYDLIKNLKELIASKLQNLKLDGFVLKEIYIDAEAEFRGSEEFQILDNRGNPKTLPINPTTADSITLCNNRLDSFLKSYLNASKINEIRNRKLAAEVGRKAAQTTFISPRSPSFVSGVSFDDRNTTFSSSLPRSVVLDVQNHNSLIKDNTFNRTSRNKAVSPTIHSFSRSTRSKRGAQYEEY